MPYFIILVGRLALQTPKVCKEILKLGDQPEKTISFCCKFSRFKNAKDKQKTTEKQKKVVKTTAIQFRERQSNNEHIIN